MSEILRLFRGKADSFSGGRGGYYQYFVTFCWPCLVSFVLFSFAGRLLQY